MVGRTEIGHKGVLKVIRDKQTIDLPVTITQSREPEIVAAEEKSDKPDLGTVSPFGLHVKDLSPGLAKELGVDQKDGVVISSVQPGSHADEAGLRARDVIIEVNRAPVKNVDAYQQALKASPKGKPVLLLVKRGDATVYVPVKPEA
jgi:serine protease Do